MGLGSTVSRATFIAPPPPHTGAFPCLNSSHVLCFGSLALQMSTTLARPPPRRMGEDRWSSSACASIKPLPVGRLATRTWRAEPARAACDAEQKRKNDEINAQERPTTRPSKRSTRSRPRSRTSRSSRSAGSRWTRGTSRRTPTPSGSRSASTSAPTRSITSRSARRTRATCPTRRSCAIRPGA